MCELVLRVTVSVSQCSIQNELRIVRELVRVQMLRDAQNRWTPRREPPTVLEHGDTTTIAN